MLLAADRWAEKFPVTLSRPRLWLETGGLALHSREVSVIHCIVSGNLGSRAERALLRRFEADPAVELIRERRSRGRRRAADRRDRVRLALDRRQVRNRDGRRVADRRLPAVLVAPPQLPTELRRHKDRLLFVRPDRRSAQAEEDLDSARLVIRAQAGEEEAKDRLYLRYADRLYRYFARQFDDDQEAEDATQEVFASIMAALPDFQLSASPVGGWVARIARNLVVSRARAFGPDLAEDPETIRRRLDEEADPAEVAALDWISDSDLFVLIERLTPAQRQVLYLRYKLGFDTAELARVLGRSQASIRQLEHRALRFLRARLTALGRAPARQEALAEPRLDVRTSER